MWLVLASLPVRAMNLDHLAHLIRPHPLMEQMRLVNLAINDLDYAPLPGVWQTPRELAQRGAGDCKDLAYSKYWLMKQVVEGDDDLRHDGLRLGQGWVWMDGRWQSHLVVLVWADEGPPWVLDSATPALLRVTQRPDLSVDFSFDESGYFQGLTRQAMTGKRVKGWSELRNKMAATDGR